MLITPSVPTLNTVTEVNHCIVVVILKGKNYSGKHTRNRRKHTNQNGKTTEQLKHETATTTNANIHRNGR